MRRASSPFVLACLTVAVVVSTTASAAARSGGATDGARAFLRAFMVGSVQACSAASPALQAEIAGMTDRATCAAAMADVRRAMADGSQEVEKDLLRSAEGAAETAQGEHFDLSGPNSWTSKRYPLAALVRDMRSATPDDMRLVLGGGPRAARGTSETTVVVDRRSTRRRLMLHGESTEGTIWTLVATPGGTPKISKSAVAGVAAVKPPAVSAFPLAPAAAGDATRVVASFEVGGTDPGNEVLVEVGVDGLAQSLAFGAAAVPPVTGSGPTPQGDFASRLARAFSAGDGAARCALYHKRLVAKVGDVCTFKQRIAAKDVTTEAQRVASADGTSVVLLLVGTGADEQTISFLVTPGPAGLSVTGVFVHLADLPVLDATPV